LKRRIAPEGRVPIYGRAISECSNSGANSSPWRQGVRDTQARLKDRKMRLCETVGKAMVQAVELTRMQNGEPVALFLRHFAPGQNDAVERIAARDKSSF
jgi:hypothetical protein